MNTLKAVQAFPPAVSFHLPPAKLPKWKRSIVCCRSSSSSSDGTESEPAGDGEIGDKRKQELTKFAEDANKEFDAIGEAAIKGLYEAEAEVCRLFRCLALICLLAATIVSSIISSPEPEWQKIASLGLILVALVAQVLIRIITFCDLLTCVIQNALS